MLTLTCSVTSFYHPLNMTSHIDLYAFILHLKALIAAYHLAMLPFETQLLLSYNIYDISRLSNKTHMIFMWFYMIYAK